MRALWLAVVAVLLALLPLACGSSQDNPDGSAFDGDGSIDTYVAQPDSTMSDSFGCFSCDAASDTADASAAMDSTSKEAEAEAGPPPTLTGIAIDPPMATITGMNGNPVQQQFQVKATFSDGSTVEPFMGAKWTSTGPAVGFVNSNGLYNANGTLGGLVYVTATYGAFSAQASLIIKIHYIENPGNVPTGTQGALQGATTPDPNVKWAYPYDLTVFPRGINETTLQWIGSTNVNDFYYIHLQAPAFELESFATASLNPNSWDFTTTAWQQFLNSTEGPADLRVTRWNSATMQATVLVDQHWIIANGSMRGTIYYSAYQVIQGVQTGRVLRVKPGAVVYDDFLDAGTSGANCTSCHTVSADGKEIVYSKGAWPPVTSYTYDLDTQTQAFSGFTNGAGGNNGASPWGLPALSADGTVLSENFAPLYRGNLGTQTGAFDPTTGNAIMGTGLDGKPMWMPAFAPDNQLIAYVDPSTHDLRAMDWDPVGKKATNDRLLIAAGSGSVIQYPTVSPDHKWVVYQRGPALGSLGQPGDVYATSTTSPAEIPLNWLNALNSTLAAGARDLHLNYGPTFAPVAAGGYFWVVFHSRRTYGNKLTQPAYVSPGVGVKQLWVAAFDQSPMPMSDPTHPAFYLGGQDPTALNTRGYWALSPCEQNGMTCTNGTDCCGGFCDDTNDAGQAVCGQAEAGACSQNGDHCTTTADCCKAGMGVTCINMVCSEPPPPPIPDGGFDAADAEGGIIIPQ